MPVYRASGSTSPTFDLSDPCICKTTSGSRHCLWLYSLRQWWVKA